MPRLSTDDGLEFELLFDPKIGGTVRLGIDEVDIGRGYTFRAWVNESLFEWRNVRPVKENNSAVFHFGPASGLPDDR